MGDIIDILIEELEEGKIFDEDELIIDKNERKMTTIRREANSNKIDIFYYDHGHEYHGIIRLNNNGYDEIYSGDEFYKRYKQKLIDAKLWD